MTRRVVLVPDGMADEPQEALGGRTPLEAAATPAMDSLARRGTVGLVRTIPPGLPPGSDVGNLSVLGYDAAAVFSGRSPLEAANLGVELGPGDVSYRCNLVTVAGGVLTDNTAGHITNADAEACFAALSAALDDGEFEFRAGVSYRGLLVWRGGEVVPCTPPHDILDQAAAAHLPGVAAGLGSSPPAARLADLQHRADEVLAGVRPATQAWFWGGGTAPTMPRFEDLYGLSGAVIGAVDLVRGIGRYAGLDVIDVPGATGDLDTDYAAKGRAALAALRDHEFVRVHVEAPDEAAHMGDVAAKVEAIERVDAEVLAPLLRTSDPPAVLVLPDHATPVRIRTHDATPVPFVFAAGGRDVAASGRAAGDGAEGAGDAFGAFGERRAAAAGLLIDGGPALMRLFLKASG